MKKVILLFLTLSLFSCSKDPKVESQSVVPANTSLPTLPASYIAPAHFKNMVNTAALGLLELSKNPLFKSEVNSKIALHFDHDDNVLLKNLQFVPLVGGSVQQQMLNAVNSYGAVSKILAPSVDNYDFDYYAHLDSIHRCFYGFEDVVDLEYHKSYVQIFIPFYSTVDINSVPTIVVGLGDEEVSRGYKFDAQGNLVVMSVDENYAKNNLVWVVSVNERVNTAGLYVNDTILRPL